MPGVRNNAFVKLACNRKWDEVYAVLDRREAGVDDCDEDGVTALHWAAYCGAGDVIDALVRRGADIDARMSTGCTPMHMSAWRNQPEAAKRLVHHGADLNAKIKNGRTSIDNARHWGHTELESWLKGARARRHWAEARALGRATTGALACASFWHAHVGELLCAPGAKWAERNRAAFEEDFHGPGE